MKKCGAGFTPREGPFGNQSRLDPQWGASQQAKMDQPVTNHSPSPPLTRSKTPCVIHRLFTSNLSTRRIRLFHLFV